MREFYPIVNFQIGEAKLSLLDVQRFYSSMIEVFGDHISDSFDTVEFSLNTACFFQDIFAIKTRLWEEELNLAIGSLISIDQLQELKEFDFVLDDYMNLFAPAFDQQVWDYIQQDRWCRETFEYIPGIYSEEEFDELLDAMPSMYNVKIFPAQVNSSKGLLKALQGPYPELRLLHLRSRILVPGDGIAKQYEVYDKYKINDSVRLVTSPRDYQKVRKEFMVDRKIKLLFQPKPRDLKKLCEKINSSLQYPRIFLTGFNETKVEDHADLVDAVATRVFKNIFLDYANGLVDLQEVKTLMHAELSKNLISAHEG